MCSRFRISWELEQWQRFLQFGLVMMTHLLVKWVLNGYTKKFIYLLYVFQRQDSSIYQHINSNYMCVFWNSMFKLLDTVAYEQNFLRVSESHRLQCRIFPEDKYKDCVWRQTDIGGILSLLSFVPENKVMHVRRLSFCRVFSVLWSVQIII